MFILIVEPHPVERCHIASILASDGFDIVQVGSAIEGMVQTVNVDPDLIVISAEVKPVRVEDVIAVTRRLTGAPVMVIGGAQGDNEMVALGSGADFFLAKPFTVPELAGRARMLVRQGRSLNPDAGGEAICRTVEMTSTPFGHHGALGRLAWRYGRAKEAA